MDKRAKVFLLTIIACIVLAVCGIFAGKIAVYVQDLSIIKANQEVVNAMTIDSRIEDVTPKNRGEEMMNAQEAIDFVCKAIEEYEKDNAKIKSLVVHIEDNYKTELDNIKGQLLWKVTIPVTAVTTSGEEVKESYMVWVDAYSGASYRVAKTLNAVWD